MRFWGAGAGSWGGGCHAWGVGPKKHVCCDSPRPFFLVHRVQHADDVAQAGQLQLGDQQDHVAHAHRRQVGRREAFAQIEDQVRIAGPQQADHAAQVFLVNQGDVFHLHRVRQQRQAALVLAQRAAQERHVEPIDVHGDVGQRVIGDQVEGDVGVAQGEIEIDEGDVVLGVLGHVAAEVDGDAGAADAALGADDRDDERFRPRGAVVGVAAGVAAAAARRLARRRCRASSSSSSTTGAVRNSLAPGPEGLQDRLAVAARADGQDRHVREFDWSAAGSAAAPCGDRSRA